MARSCPLYRPVGLLLSWAGSGRKIEALPRHSLLIRPEAGWEARNVRILTESGGHLEQVGRELTARVLRSRSRGSSFSHFFRSSFEIWLRIPRHVLP